MGNDCSPDEREFRYSAFHQSIYAIENDIKKELYNQDLSNKKYMPFGLINQGLCKKYDFLLNENFDKNEAKNNILDYNDLAKKNEGKDFSKIHPQFEFSFPSNFIFINKDFMDIIRDYVPEKYKKDLKTNFDTIIGGGCLIMKNPNDEKDEKPFRYIILYNELKENIGNEINFFLYIKDKNKRKETVDYILKNNLTNYFKKIDYNYKEENKKISSNYYIVRCCDVSLIEKLISKIEQNKNNEFDSQKKYRPASFDRKARNKEFDIKNSQNKNLEKNYFYNNIQNINNFNEKNFQNFKMSMNIMNNMNMDFNCMNLNLQNNKKIDNNNNSQNLLEENKYLKNENENLKNSLLTKNNEIQNLKNSLLLKEKENENLKSTIQSKDDQINELKIKIGNFENKNEFVNSNQIRVVQFISDDHSLICGINCLLSDTFAEVEEKLYKIHPEYRETNNAFTVNGKGILRFKTIADNNIQTGQIVKILRID